VRFEEEEEEVVGACLKIEGTRQKVRSVCKGGHQKLSLKDTKNSPSSFPLMASVAMQTFCQKFNTTTSDHQKICIFTWKHGNRPLLRYLPESNSIPRTFSKQNIAKTYNLRNC